MSGAAINPLTPILKPWAFCKFRFYGQSPKCVTIGKLWFCLFFNFTKFVILENLSVLDFALSEVKGSKDIFFWDYSRLKIRGNSILQGAVLTHSVHFVHFNLLLDVERLIDNSIRFENGLNPIATRLLPVVSIPFSERFPEVRALRFQN